MASQPIAPLPKALLTLAPRAPRARPPRAQLLGTDGFLAALAAATLYLVGTFVATHQLERNYQVEGDYEEPSGGYESSGDWMLDQMHATNNVMPENRHWSACCGGINNHVRARPSQSGRMARKRSAPAVPEPGLPCPI